MTADILTPNHVFISKKLGLTASEREVLRHIRMFASKKGHAFVCATAFAETLGFRRETITRAVSKLISKGFLEKIGRHLNLFPVVRPILPVISRSHPCDKNSEKHALTRQKNHTELELNKFKKEQPGEVACSKKSSLIEKKQKVTEVLRTIGISRNNAKQLLSRFPLERIERQMENLKHQTGIKNPPGWLMKAIRDDFVPRETSREESQAEDQAKEKARMIFQDAQTRNRKGEYEEAKRAAQQSLKIFPTPEAAELIKEIEAFELKRAKQEAARAAISEERFAEILAEEEEKQKTIFMRMGFTRIGELGRKAAYAAAMERAVSAR